ncbi:MAG: hypothetical protein ACTSUK_04000 [Promethearchaeota archaeon]
MKLVIKDRYKNISQDFYFDDIDISIIHENGKVYFIFEGLEKRMSLSMTFNEFSKFAKKVDQGKNEIRKQTLLGFM